MTAPPYRTVTAYACYRCDAVYSMEIDAIQCFRSHEGKARRLQEFVPDSPGYLEVVNLVNDHWNLTDGSDPLTSTDHDLPFMCEMILYPLLGKEDARTVLALLRQAVEKEELLERQRAERTAT